MKKVVFVHSSYRVSSTWFWNKFRLTPGVIAYCEFFHEQLAMIDANGAQRISHNKWRSNHPITEPYFKEYSSLIEDGVAGIRGYSANMSLLGFVPQSGIDGNLDEAQIAYVERLLKNASELGLYPVLTCTRSLGRAHGLKRHFSGYHVLIYRNLFQQFMSYLGQMHYGNFYFIKTLSTTIEHNRHDPYINLIYDRYCHNKGRKGDVFGCFKSLENAIRVFWGLHVYLYIHAYEVCDLMVDVNRLVGNQEQQKFVEKNIFTYSGIELDLSDARNNIEFSKYWATPLLSKLEDDCNELLLEALKQLGIERQSPEEDFGRMLLCDMLGEVEKYQFYTQAMYAYVASSRQSSIASNMVAARHAITSFLGKIRRGVK